MLKLGNIVILKTSKYNEIHKRFIIQEERSKYWRKKFLDCTCDDLPDLLGQPYGIRGFSEACRYCKNVHSDRCFKCRMEVSGGYLPMDYSGPLEKM